MPSGTAKRNRPNVSEDTLREIKRLLTGDREQFRPATLGESLKYNFLGLTPQKEEGAGSFGKALMSEAGSQFRELFGIKTTKAGRKAEEEAMLEKAQKEAELAEQEKERSEKNLDAIQAILGEVRTIRKVTEGSVKYSTASGRYHDQNKGTRGQFLTNEMVTEISSGTDAPTENNEVATTLAAIEENTAELGQSSIFDALAGIGGLLGNIIKTLGSGFSSLVGPLLGRAGSAIAGAGSSLLALGATSVGAASTGAIVGTVGTGLAAGALIGDQFNTSVAEGGSGNLSDWWKYSGSSMFGLRKTNAEKEDEAQQMAFQQQLAATRRARAAGQVANTRADAQRLQESSAQAATPAPVVVNNVDASSNPVVAPSTPAASQNVTVTLRDSHGSHLRFQESRLTRPM
jgi:hypothetical protein